jgi:hypothetical protein
MSWGPVSVGDLGQSRSAPFRWGRGRRPPGDRPQGTSGMDSCWKGERSLSGRVVRTVATGNGSAVRRGPEEAR